LTLERASGRTSLRRAPRICG